MNNKVVFVVILNFYSILGIIGSDGEIPDVRANRMNDTDSVHIE